MPTVTEGFSLDARFLCESGASVKPPARIAPRGVDALDGLSFKQWVTSHLLPGVELIAPALA
jgi:hypothetical protein